MPLDLAERAKKTEKLEAKFEDGTIAVEFSRSGITPRVQMELIDLPAPQTYKLILRVVRAWDLTNGGKKVPLTEEALQDVPTEILETVLLAIWNHIRPPDGGNGTGSFS